MKSSEKIGKEAIKKMAMSALVKGYQTLIMEYIKQVAYMMLAALTYYFITTHPFYKEINLLNVLVLVFVILIQVMVLINSFLILAYTNKGINECKAIINDDSE